MDDLSTESYEANEIISCPSNFTKQGKKLVENRNGRRYYSANDLETPRHPGKIAKWKLQNYLSLLMTP